MDNEDKMIQDKDIRIISVTEGGDLIETWVELGGEKIHIGKLKYGYTKQNLIDDITALKNNMNMGIILLAKERIAMHNKTLEDLKNGRN